MLVRILQRHGLASRLAKTFHTRHVRHLAAVTSLSSSEKHAVTSPFRDVVVPKWSLAKTFHTRLARHLAAVTSLSATEKHAVTSPFRDVVVPKWSLSKFVWHRIDEWPDKTALVCGVSGHSYTYAQLRTACHRFACSLRRAGFEPGQVLAVVLPNSPDYAVAVLGASEAGMVVTTVNPVYVPHEISKQLSDSKPSVIVTAPEMYQRVMDATRLAEPQGYKQPMVIILEDFKKKEEIPHGTVSFRGMIADDVDVSSGVPEHSFEPQSTTAVILYSSGTTGLPKGVMLSHTNLVANSLQLQGDFSIALAQPSSGDYQDCLPAILPMYHVYGLVVLLISKLFIGCKIVTLPKFDPTTFLNTLINHRPTILYLVPPLVLFLGSSPAATADHFTSVRYMLCGAAPLGVADLHRFKAKTPASVRSLQVYGLTETSPTLFHSQKESTKLASVGPCIPSVVAKVVHEETGEALGPDRVGEICSKGPQNMLGYHNNAAATEAMIDKDGWLHTGDLGYYDKDNVFYIVDRLKELIKVKGLQVAPAELEELLRSHPDVSDAAVIGIPDTRSGEVPRGYVVAKPGSCLERLERDLKIYVESRVSAHKHLAGGIRFLEAIPKSPAGKILRKVLREQYKMEAEGKS